jgi:hypothetical protein
VGAGVLGGALDALLFVNARLIETGEVATFDDLSLRALVRHLGQPGAQARWANRDEVEPGTCSPHSFAHVKMGQRRQLRNGYALWLKERTARHAPPVKISPPPVTDTRSGSARLVLIEAGLFVCGVGHQVVPAVEVAQQGRMNIARDLWKPLRTHATQLGGGQSSVELSGYLCRICSTALEQSHSVGLGPMALERCLVAHLCPDLLGKLAYGTLIVVNGLAGWSTLVARAHRGNSPSQPVRPNAKPWEHLGDLDVVRKQLRLRLG